MPKLKSPEKEMRAERATVLRSYTLESIKLALLKGSLPKNEAIGWIDLVLRCRSLADMEHLNTMIVAVTGIDPEINAEFYRLQRGNIPSKG